MALPTYGPRPGETDRQYLDRLNRERMARLGLGDSRGRPPDPVPTAPARPAAAIRMRRELTEDEQLAALQAEATARALEMEQADRRAEESDRRRTLSIGEALPAPARAASGVRANHPKIQEADLPERIDRRTDGARWFARIRAAAAGGHPGLSWHAIEKYGEQLLYVERRDGVGLIRRTVAQLAKLTRYCERHITRLRAWYELHGLIDVLNSLRWEGNEQRRGPNVIVPTVDEERAPPPDDVTAPLPAGLVTRALTGLHRLGALFDLAVRPWGLNKTPLSNRRGRLSPA